MAQPAPEADRDALITVMVDRYVEVAQSIPEQFMRSRMLNVLNALLASGFRPAPRTVSTVEDVSALARGTILQGSLGQAYLVHAGCIFGAGNSRPLEPHEVSLPATVLFVPSEAVE